jgi:hypothetical protein
MILYAVGSKRLFAVVDVVPIWKENDEERWPYRVDIQWPSTMNVARSDGVDANDVSADLPQRVRRRSRIRLAEHEFGLAATRSMPGKKADLWAHCSVLQAPENVTPAEAGQWKP